MQLRRIPADIFSLTVTTAAAAFHDNDQIGTVMEIPGLMEETKGKAILRSLTLLDKAAQKSELDILFFSENPTNAVASNDAASISDAEMASKFLGHVKILATDYEDLAACSFATKQNLSLLLECNTDRSQSIWALVVSRGTPTYGSTSDLVFKLGVEKC